MINDQEFLQGAAFLRLINYGSRVTSIHAPLIHPSMYLVETDSSKSAVLFKISKKPKSAWSFTLSSPEELALDTLHSKYPNISVIRVLSWSPQRMESILIICLRFSSLLKPEAYRL